MRTAQALTLTARLGLADLMRERAAFGCQALALAAVLAPLLLLFGLKYGVVRLMTDELLADAEVREIVIKGGKEHPLSLLDELRRDPHVGFVGPHIAAVNVSLSFAVAGQAVARSADGTVLATGRGDPLLGAASPPERGELVLSASLARALDAATGASVIVVPSRKLGGQTTAQPFTFKVAAVLPPTAWQSRGALLYADDLLELHQWAEGYAIPRLGLPGRPPLANPTVPTFRLYAADLDSVAPLVDFLTARGVDHVARMQRIASLRDFERTLGFVFLVIATVAGTGSALAFGASLWGNVARKQRELGTLRLLGISRRHVVAFPLAQALAVAVAGWLAALLLICSGRLRAERWPGARLRARRRGLPAGAGAPRGGRGGDAADGAARGLGRSPARHGGRSCRGHPPCDLSA